MSKYNSQQPYISSYLIVRKGSKVAFILRQNTGWRDGFYSLPAGKVEQNESASAAIVRESKEEIGIDITTQDIVPTHMSHRYEGDEWIDIFFEAKEYNGEPYNAEPDKHGEIAWFDLDNLPENVIPSLRYVLDKIKIGAAYSEYGWN